MTRSELVKALNAARTAVEQAHNDKLEKSHLISEQREVNQINESAAALAKSLRFMMGPAGNVCPACNGSGRL